MQTQDEAMIMAVVLLTAMEDSTLHSMIRDIQFTLQLNTITDFQREYLQNWLNVIDAELHNEEAEYDQ